MLGTSSFKRFSLFTVFRVPIFADAGALILIVFIMLMIGGNNGALGLIQSLILILVVFFSVLAHELGHAFAIRKLGYGGSQIVLSGLGGVTQWRGKPNNKHRIWIAIAGPIVSLALAGIGYGLREVVPSGDSVGMQLLGALVFYLAFMNLLWGVFNLLPVWPLDGGKVARALMSMKMPQRKAVQWSLKLSGAIGLAVVIVAAGMGFLFVAILMAWLLIQNWNEWQTVT